MASISGFEEGARLIRNAIGGLDRIEAATVGNSRRVKELLAADSRQALDIDAAGASRSGIARLRVCQPGTDYLNPPACC
jgi:hypothetical protein